MASFLQDLWHDKPDNAHILIWTLPDRRSEYFTDYEDAQTFALRMSQQYDVYVGVGLRPEAYGPDKRGGSDDICAINALWLDVDVKHPVHRKTNLFETNNDAVTFVLETTPLEPTWIIDSGHGIQCWWLFKEPWVFENEKDRLSAGDLSRRWTQTFRNKAHHIGIEIDSLYDLARVLRIPSTLNHKDKQNVVPTSALSYADIRYDPSEFEPYLTEAATDLTDGTPIDVGDYVIDFTASPPFQKFEMLQETNGKFRQSWAHRRRDMSDDSNSAYDQSLASIAAKFGWTAQEIVNLLIAHRRKYDDTKPLTPTYFRITLRKAFGWAGDSAQQDAIISEINAAESPETRLDQLARLIGGIRIRRLVKYMSDPPVYRLETDQGAVSLGQANGLITQRSFATHVADATRKIMPVMKEDKWRVVAQILLDILVEESAGEEATDAGQARSWLRAYLAERKPSEAIADAIRSESPFMLNGSTYVFGTALRKWLVVSHSERVDQRQLGIALRALNCVPEIRTIRDGENRTSRHIWKVPTEMLNGNEDGGEDIVLD